MKNPFKKNKQAAPAPRELKDIQLAYQQLCLRAGQTQYQISVLSDDLKELNRQIVAVNNEGAARKQLDAEAKANATPAAVPTTDAPKGA